jgi:hypothetical protein
MIQALIGLVVVLSAITLSLTVFWLINNLVWRWPRLQNALAHGWIIVTGTAAVVVVVLGLWAVGTLATKSPLAGWLAGFGLLG